MGKSTKKVENANGNNKKTKKNNYRYLIGASFFLVIVIVFFFIKGISNSPDNTATTGNTAAGNDLIIAKSEIADTPKFVPYKVGNTKMEIITLKASDGTIRTVFNTCQVCYSSGRGYYKVDGDSLVCQNCGNRFKFDQLGKEKGGCNPVPILSEDLKEDTANITIPKDYLQQAEVIFENWKV